MKTERRHELQTNALADSLTRWIEAVKPYSRALVAGLVAIVALVFAWSYYSSHSRTREADGWNEYFSAMNTRDPRDALSEVATRYAGTSVAQWARVVLADIQLDDGTNRLFVEKASVREELQRTIDTYQAILLEGGDRALLERATFGLARAREAMGKDLAKARDEYRQLVKKWPDSPFAGPAEARAKDLERTDTKQFYDWLAKYEPPRPMSGEPGTPGARPDFLKDSLEPKDIKLPSVLDQSAPGGAAPSIPQPAGDTAPGDTAPENAAPDSSPQADAPPADKPAEPAATEPQSDQPLEGSTDKATDAK